MGKKSKKVNQNNFVRWVELEGVTIADLQAHGLDGLEDMGRAQRICGLNISLQVDNAKQQVIASLIFKEGSFPALMKVQNSDNLDVTPWQTTSRIFVSGLVPGKYKVLAQKSDDGTCTASSSFEILEVCGIGVDLYQNKGSITLQHKYDKVNAETEYRITTKTRQEPAVGADGTVYDWAVRTRLTVEDLPDGDYNAYVRKKGYPKCEKMIAFKIVANYLQVVDFLNQGLKEVENNTWSPEFIVRNNSANSKEFILDISSPESSVQIRSISSGPGFAPVERVVDYTSPRRYLIPPKGGETRLSIMLNNRLGYQANVSVTLMDADPTSAGLQMITTGVGGSTYSKQPRITMKFNT